MEVEKLREKIKSSAANIAVVAALNVGFAFFDFSIFIDVAIISALAFMIHRWNSRLSALLIAIFSAFAIYIQFPNFEDAGGWRLLALVWLLWSGIVALFYTFNMHNQVHNSQTQPTSNNGPAD